MPCLDLCWGLTACQPLWVILCCLPEKGRKEIEEIVKEMKERNREELALRMNYNSSSDNKLKDKVYDHVNISQED